MGVSFNLPPVPEFRELEDAHKHQLSLARELARIHNIIRAHTHRGIIDDFDVVSTGAYSIPIQSLGVAQGTALTLNFTNGIKAGIAANIATVEFDSTAEINFAPTLSGTGKGLLTIHNHAAEIGWYHYAVGTTVHGGSLILMGDDSLSLLTGAGLALDKGLIITTALSTFNTDVTLGAYDLGATDLTSTGQFFAKAGGTTLFSVNVGGTGDIEIVCDVVHTIGSYGIVLEADKRFIINCDKIGNVYGTNFTVLGDAITFIECGRRATTGVDFFDLSSANFKTASTSANGLSHLWGTASLELGFLHTHATSTFEGNITLTGYQITNAKVLQILAGAGASLDFVNAGGKHSYFQQDITQAGDITYTLPPTLAAGLFKTTAGGVMSLATLATADVTAKAITYACIQDVTATSRILGRKSAGAGVIEELTSADVATMIGAMSNALTTNHIFAGVANVATDCTVAGDVTLSASGTTATTAIASGVIVNDDVSTTAAIASSKLGADDGWRLFIAAGTRTSGTVFTTASDLSANIQVGDKVKYTDTTTKYGYVTAVATTTITITGGSNYSLVGNPSNIYISHEERPIGFPDYFDYVPTFTAVTGNYPTYTLGSAKFNIKGKQVTMYITEHIITSASGSGGSYVTVPVTALGFQGNLFGQEYYALGHAIIGYLADTSKYYFVRHDNAYISVNGYKMQMTAIYLI